MERINVPSATSPNLTWHNQSSSDNHKIQSSSNPNCHMSFDGENLNLYEGDQLKHQLSGMSGQPGYQCTDYQNLPNKGPLPEGNYSVRQENRQKIDLPNAIKGLNPFRKTGTWPGSVLSWGKERAWLDPAPSNNMYGRNNFTIHGGLTKGSAGCIDIPWQTNTLSNYLDDCQEEVPLNVKYRKNCW